MAPHSNPTKVCSSSRYLLLLLSVPVKSSGAPPFQKDYQGPTIAPRRRRRRPVQPPATLAYSNVSQSQTEAALIL